VNRPGSGRAVRYERKSQKGPTPTKQSVFRELIVFRRTAGDGMPLSGTYQLTAAMRGAMLSHALDPCPEVISGHGPGSTPENPVRSERPHVALVPLAFVGSLHATGQVLGLAALLPSQLSAEEREQCLCALLPIRMLKMAAAGVWEIAPTSSETLQYNLRPDAWTKPSRHWATITPFVFDRFPKDRYGQEAEEIVRQACERIGLPRPASFGVLPVSPHIGVPLAAHFAPAPDRPGKPRRLHQHVILTFDEPVAGPIALGAGRYYGYGFCRPIG
jgi:CRISPR-associated protein Csb2